MEAEFEVFTCELGVDFLFYFKGFVLKNMMGKFLNYFRVEMFIYEVLENKILSIKIFKVVIEFE